MTNAMYILKVPALVGCAAILLTKGEQASKAQMPRVEAVAD